MCNHCTNNTPINIKKNFLLNKTHYKTRNSHTYTILKTQYTQIQNSILITGPKLWNSLVNKDVINNNKHKFKTQIKLDLLLDY